MRAFDLRYQSKDDLVYFDDVDGEEVCGWLTDVEISDTVLVCYRDEFGATQFQELEYDDEVTVVYPLGGKE